MYLILEVIAKINKELVQPPYKLFVIKGLTSGISFKVIFTFMNEHIKREIFTIKFIRRIMSWPIFTMC